MTDEAAEAEAHAADLLRRGYTEVQEWEHLHVGDRVKHVGELYTSGPTATIERIFHRRWARPIHSPDVELIVKRDKPVFGTDYGFWANYHTVKAGQ